jgi:hypothetical protein
VLKMKLMETTSLLKKEDSQVGREHQCIIGQSFFSLKNGPGWADSFQLEKWIEISDGQ